MSIKLILENINCYTNAEFIFERGKLTLIKGPSGRGKSSIFRGITWGLYGNIKGICNFNATKCSIKILLPEITVIRCNKSPKLQVTYNNIIYDDKVAQDIIDKYFGTEDIWNVTCYLEQDSRSLLLGGSNNERMDILNKLSFWDDNPEVYLQKIDAEIKSNKDLVIKETERYNAEKDLYEDQLRITPVDERFGLTKPQIEILGSTLNKLNQNLNQLHTELDSQNKIMGSVSTLQNKLNQNIISKKSYKSKDEYHADCILADENIMGLNKKIEDINYQINISSIESITKNQLKSKESELNSIINHRDGLNKSLKMYETNLNSLKDQYESLGNTAKLKYVDMEKYPSINLKTLTRKDLYIEGEKERMRLEGQSKCKMLSVEYTKEAIDTFITNLRNKVNEMILYKADIEIINNMNIYISKLNKRYVTGPPSLEEVIREINEINNKITGSESKYNNMLLSKNLHKCPHCTKSIRFVNGEMIGDPSIIYTKEQIGQVLQELNSHKDMKRELELTKNDIEYIERLRPMLKILDSRSQIPDISQLDTYKNCLLAAEKIIIVEPSLITSNELTRVLEYQEALIKFQSFDQSLITQLNSHINNIKHELERISLGIDEEFISVKGKIRDIELNINKVNIESVQEIQSLKLKINNLTQDRLKSQQAINNLEYLTNEINLINTELSQLNSKVIPDTKEKINKMNEEISTVKLWLEGATYYVKMMERRSLLEIRANDLNNKHRSMESLYSLREVAFNLECDHLQTTVDSINESLNDILQNIFDKPIKVILNLYKKNKTNDKIRANVNLNIQYDGNEYDSINKLSGGEKDRISFALTLALSRINGAEFLLLDETLRSLNDEYRTLCLEAMKQFYNGNKTIFCINHEDVEGNYDHVIQL